MEVNNGFIHVMDAVMLPPELTVWELVESSDDFTTLQLAIETAGLEGTLNGTLSNKTCFCGIISNEQNVTSDSNFMYSY